MSSCLFFYCGKQTVRLQSGNCRRTGPHDAQVELVFVEDSTACGPARGRSQEGGLGVPVQAEPPSPCLKLIKIIR